MNARALELAERLFAALCRNPPVKESATARNCLTPAPGVKQGSLKDERPSFIGFAYYQEWNDEQYRMNDGSHVWWTARDAEQSRSYPAGTVRRACCPNLLSGEKVEFR